MRTFSGCRYFVDRLRCSLNYRTGLLCRTFGYDIKKRRRIAAVKRLRRMSEISRDTGVCKTPHERALIVSLTSFGPRIGNVPMVVESLMQQSVKADRIVLWLEEKDVRNTELPEDLLRLKSHGLEIRTCGTILGSYTKIVPSFEAFPEADIITVDDDILYPPYLIERLVEMHRKYPEDIIAMRCHRMRKNSDGGITSYKYWDKECHGECGYDLLGTACAGMLYPAGSMPMPMTCDSGVFMHIAPKADDLWLKAMATLNGRAVRRAPGFSWRKFVELEEVGPALNTQNVYHGGNDRQMSALLEYFPELSDKLQQPYIPKK